jgi:hypothetical protein
MSRIIVVIFAFILVIILFAAGKAATVVLVSIRLRRVERTAQAVTMVGRCSRRLWSSPFSCLAVASRPSGRNSHDEVIGRCKSVCEETMS